MKTRGFRGTVQGMESPTLMTLFDGCTEGSWRRAALALPPRDRGVGSRRNRREEPCSQGVRADRVCTVPEFFAEPSSLGSDGACHSRGVESGTASLPLRYSSISFFRRFPLWPVTRHPQHGWRNVGTQWLLGRTFFFLLQSSEQKTS